MIFPFLGVPVLLQPRVAASVSACSMLFAAQHPWPRSHHDLVEHYYAQYDAQVASGEFQPFLYPWGAWEPWSSSCISCSPPVAAMAQALSVSGIRVDNRLRSIRSRLHSSPGSGASHGHRTAERMGRGVDERNSGVQ